MNIYIRYTNIQQSINETCFHTTLHNTTIISTPIKVLSSLSSSSFWINLGLKWFLTSSYCIDILHIIDVKFSNFSPIESWALIDTFLPECEVSPIFINGVLLTVCPDKCLSNFSLVRTLFVASTASLKLFIGNKSNPI